MCYQDLTKLGLETKSLLTPGLETKTVDGAPRSTDQDGKFTFNTFRMNNKRQK